MDISVKDLKARMDAGDQDFVLIDVREPGEHDAFNIGGTLVPVGTIAGAVDDLEAHKDKEVIVYCRSGARSGMAQGFLQQQGFKNVRNLTGGMMAWQAM
ncbi:rhodanese-like domain-containing protein [Lewinella cohaerens]|uniref:rhodanese-like domain-containing protein n=1 Tax=Lewinella cohaerens TaxID=70995 RepID=UPI00037BBE24|nr:rhodanese-like domain-containing protein [Lewinella cohaerens]